MNGWDLMTWIMAVGLITLVMLIFIAFMKDAKGVLERAGQDSK